MKKTLKPVIAAVAAAAMSFSAKAYRTYTEPGTTTFTGAETESGYVWIGSTSGAYEGENDWRIWTTDGSESASSYGINLSSGQIRIADGNGQTGRLKIESGTYLSSSGLWLGKGTGTGYYWQTGGDMTFGGQVNIGETSGGSGTFILDGGTASVGGYACIGMGGAGTFRMTGGTYNQTANYFIVGQGSGGGSATISGGTLNIASYTATSYGTAGWAKPDSSILIGEGTGGGTMTVSGDDTEVFAQARVLVGIQGNGTLNLNGGKMTVENELIVGAANDKGANVSGTVNIAGGVMHTTSNVKFGYWNSTGVGTLNLNGGRLEMKGTSLDSGTGIFNMNGGTVAPIAASSEFIKDTNNNGERKITVNVLSGGAVFDTAGFNVTIPATLNGTGPIVKTGKGILTISSDLELARTFKFIPGAELGPIALTGGNTLAEGGRIAIDIDAANAAPGKTYTLMTGLDTGLTLADNFTLGTATGCEVAFDLTDGTLSCTLTRTAKPLAGGTTELEDDTDWTAYSVSLAADSILDLNGHNLVLGHYTAAAGAQITNSVNGDAAVLTLGAGNGVMEGNANVQFTGNMTVKVTGSDATGFGPEIANTHTGGWIFQNNNYAITLKYHTNQMGAGPVVFNGNGGFTTHYDSTKANWYESGARTVQVNGTNNTFVSTMNADFNEFLRHASLTGSGELILTGTVKAEFAENADWSDFEGTVVIRASSSGDFQPYFWLPDSNDAKKAAFVVDGSKRKTTLFFREAATAGAYELGDLATPSATYNANAELATPGAYNSAPTTIRTGYLNRDSAFAGRVWDKLSITKVGSGTWTFNSYLSNSGTITVDGGRLDFMNTGGANAAFVVNANGTLGGTGTINGSLTVNGTVAPGTNTAETLTVAGTTTFNEGAKLSVVVGEEGTANCLALTGAGEVSLANLTIDIPDKTQLVRGSGCTYTLLTAANGSLADTPHFAGVSRARTMQAADGSYWRLAVSSNALTLSETDTPGLILIIR